MKANPGYRWCPTTSKPVKSPPCQPVNNARKKVWSYPSSSGVAKDSPTAKRVPKTESMPQFNFAMAGESTAGRSARRLPRLLWSRVFLFCPDPTKMGGLSMLLLAGEHALTNREVGHYYPPLSPPTPPLPGAFLEVTS